MVRTKQKVRTAALSVRLIPETMDKLERLAKEKNLSRGELVDAAVAALWAQRYPGAGVRKEDAAQGAAMGFPHRTCG